MAKNKQVTPIITVIRGADWFFDYIFFSDNDFETMELEIDEWTLEVIKIVRGQIEKRLDAFKKEFEWVDEGKS